MQKKGLGKGLGALLTEAEVKNGEYIMQLKIIEVEPNKNQPRTNFDTDKLADLSDSIKEHGVITPIIVQKNASGFYQIIAGERRWRAAKAAGLKTIPAIVKDYDSVQTYEVSLIENLQREDLNPIEEAMGYKRLADEFSLTQEQISQKLSKSRSSIANSLRLLNLPKEVIKLIELGDLSMGHAKVLLSSDNDIKQMELAKLVVENGLSVRELEKLLKTPVKRDKVKQDLNLKLALNELEKKISDIFSTNVKIINGTKKGKIEIEYYGTDDLERIVKMLKI